MSRRRVGMFLSGEGDVWKRGRCLSWFLPTSTSLHTQTSPILSRLAHVALLTVSPFDSTTDQPSSAEVEESRIVLAILHQTGSYLDRIILPVVFTNVMRKLLI